jgi:hypothetical protein
VSSVALFITSSATDEQQLVSARTCHRGNTDNSGSECIS